jgi:hypothetical protein
MCGTQLIRWTAATPGQQRFDHLTTTTLVETDLVLASGTGTSPRLKRPPFAFQAGKFGAAAALLRQRANYILVNAL